MPALLPSTSTLLTKVKGILPAQNIKNDLEMIGVLNSKLATIVYNRDGLFPSSFFIPLPVSTCILHYYSVGYTFGFLVFSNFGFLAKTNAIFKPF